MFGTLARTLLRPVVTTGRKFSNVVTLYNRKLDEKPFLTTCITTGVCYGLGDFLAQKLGDKNYRISRTVIYTVFGIAIGGPCYFVWFRKLHHFAGIIKTITDRNLRKAEIDKVTSQLRDNIHKAMLEKELNAEVVAELMLKIKNSRSNLGLIEREVIISKTTLVAKVLLDQFVFSSMYPILFMMSTGVMLGSYDQFSEKGDISYSDIINIFKNSYENLKKKYIKIFVTDCAVWPMIQMTNFAFVSVPMQAVVVSAVNVFWNAFLCYVNGEEH